jgi:hypothetical protein
VNELDLEKETMVPTTNLVKNVHSSIWIFAKNGRKLKAKAKKPKPTNKIL